MRLALAVLVLPLTFAPATASGASPARSAAPSLVLNEFMAGPARDWDGTGTFSSRDDEWVEVRNPDPGTLDLTGYLLSDGDSIPRFAFSGTLGPQQRLLVFGRQSYDWERANGFPAFGLSLGNSGDAVLLWKVTPGDTVLVDSYVYRSHEAAADRSVGRLNDSGAWGLFDGLNPYTGTTPPTGNQCDPTPGGSNVCGVTPAGAATWGRLKAIYR